MVTQAKIGVHKPNSPYAHHALHIDLSTDIVEHTYFSQANK